jgi:predicted transcriptional regulator
MTKKATDRTQQLSRRERQIMDVLYAHGHATAAEVMQRLPEAPSYSAVRAMLRILEEKGHVAHVHDGPRYVYRPIVAREAARRGALEHLIRTFFDGSPASAAAALLESADGQLEEADLERLSDLIERSRREGR